MSFGDGHVFALPTRSYHPRWARPHPKNLHVPSSPALSPRGRSYHPTHTLKIYEYLRHLPCHFEVGPTTPHPQFKNLPGPTTPHPRLKIYEYPRHLPCRLEVGPTTPHPSLKFYQVPPPPTHILKITRSHHPPPTFKILPGRSHHPPPRLKIYEVPTTSHPSLKIYEYPHHLPCRLEVGPTHPPTCVLKKLRVPLSSPPCLEVDPIPTGV
ncbi:hypothetical protein EDD16DRAFT_1706774 [Pisolithus croceorrhizus]|nr:hypothetical protein EDD16DRAFT_1706774 [Pisolithus croceorrhizus]